MHREKVHNHSFPRCSNRIGREIKSIFIALLPLNPDKAVRIDALNGPSLRWPQVPFSHITHAHMHTSVRRDRPPENPVRTAVGRSGGRSVVANEKGHETGRGRRGRRGRLRLWIIVFARIRRRRRRRVRILPRPLASLASASVAAATTNAPNGRPQIVSTSRYGNSWWHSREVKQINNPCRGDTSVI